MEFNYESGKLVTEPVKCPDGDHLKIMWGDSYDVDTDVKIPGIEIFKTIDPSRDYGTGAWYSLEDLKKLGGGNLQKGINIVGQTWYRTLWLNLHTIRPLNDEIKNLNED